MSFKIRSEQVQALEDASFPEFAEELVVHLKQFSPLHARVLGDDGLRKMIALGKQRAARFGMTSRSPVKLYVELLFILGTEFHSDPQYPQMAQVLTDSKLTDQLARATRLHELVLDYLQRASGPKRVFAKRALKHVRALPYEGPNVASPDYGANVIAKMKEIHPERCEYIGEPSLQKLVARGIEESAVHQIDSDAGVTLVIALMFILGHGVMNDPKYAFARSTLENENLKDPNKRAERLYSKAMTYLDHAMNFQR